MGQGRNRIGVPISTAYFVEKVHNHWIDVVNRDIWIHGVDMNTDSYQGIEPGVEFMMANKVIKNLHILRRQSAAEPVTIHLHTCGGIYEEGMAIYDTIKSMPYQVTIISYTHARSMSSIIFQAGDIRLMMPNSYFMFHLGTLELGGELRTVQSNIDFIKLGAKTMVDIYVEKARGGPKFKGWSQEKIRALINREMEKKSDVFLTPEQAIDWGFADGILQEWPN
ncbi:MAG: ATP-dependent Clp protease proteolytic subunit [Candidatus Buchananbacteria bacterium]|nr:ATP-dependent Clp protease proteolytic subunit [Candidatus Buchananbacteria bacterium]